MDPRGWIIHDGNWQDFVEPPVIDGEQKTHGLITRDYTTHPTGCFSYAQPFPQELLIPESEWPDRLAKQQASKSGLFDLRELYYDTLKSLNQDGLCLCWAFSSTKATMYVKALQGELVRLSAWWVAGKVKGWRDQGGWGAESLGEIVSAGVPLESLCPSYSSQYDTAATRADAATRKVTQWWDGYDDPDLNRRIMVSCFLMGLPPVIDLNWMGHSMCGCRLVSLDPLTVDTDNSWGESAGNKGLYRLVGSKAIPDSLVIPRVAMAA